MYLDYFGLNRLPFSIAPDPDLLYLSPYHHEALAHLNYALTGHGGLICLTGEVGMGKTTLCRAFIDQAPAHIDIAYIFNPLLSATELLQAICQELEIPCKSDSGEELHSNKQLIDILYQALIARYASGRKVICIIDEAQSMPAPLLEQIRLLTNLETNRDKLLTLILVGQPELQDMLAEHSIRQLDQRITARYHIERMQKKQLLPYLSHRLQQAGCDKRLFSTAAVGIIWRAAGGIPRLINSMSDRALLGAYATGQAQVTATIAKQAVIEVVGSRMVKKKMAKAQGSAKLLIGIGAFVAVIIPLLFLVSNPAAIKQVQQYAQAEQNPYQQLAQAYGLDADQSVLDSCQAIAANTGHACLSLRWDVADLKRLQQTIALYDGQHWQVISASSIQQVPQEAIVLWQPVTGFERAVKPGTTHTIIGWVREQFMAQSLDDERDGEQAGLSTAGWQVIAPKGGKALNFQHFYDPVLAQKVAAFQQRMGLKPDRIIGLKTLLALQGQNLISSGRQDASVIVADEEL